MTIPFLLNVFQSNAIKVENSSQTSSILPQQQDPSSLNVLQINQFKQKIVEANLIAKIFSSLSTEDRINEFLKDKDVNHLICFLGIL